MLVSYFLSDSNIQTQHNSEYALNGKLMIFIELSVAIKHYTHLLQSVASVDLRHRVA